MINNYSDQTSLTNSVYGGNSGLYALNFENGVTAFGYDIFASTRYLEYTITLQDSDDNVLGLFDLNPADFSIIATNFITGFIGYASDDALIHSAVIEGTNTYTGRTYGNLYLDNLVYESSTASAVPEPSSLIMLGARLLVMLVSAERRGLIKYKISE